MNIAVLSDIHGNDIALNAVLTELKSKEINHIIVAGDHISDCPNPINVIDKLIKLDAFMIKGNREQYILDYVKSAKNDWSHYDQMKSIEWTRSLLREKDFKWLSNLEEQITINFNGKDSIRVVHGSTDSMFEHLYKDKEERLNEVLSNIKEYVLICGHSHLPWSRRLNDKLVVNPGSVGVSFNKVVSADYAILTWNENRWDVKHYSAHYSFDELYDSFAKSKLYDDGGIWGKLILQSIKDGKNRNIEFINLALKFKKELGDNSKGFISNEIWQKAIQSWGSI